MTVLPRHPLANWTPFRVARHAHEMIIDWCHLDTKRFTEPFFYETIVKVIAHPFNQIFQQRTSIEVLAELPRGLAPSGFIFHMARCGSTLCAQALASNPAHIVMSEPLPVRGILRAGQHGPASQDDIVRWLAGMINALGQPRFPGEQQFFVKFMAADALQLPLILSVFPGVPWVFLYRDPLEILASQRAQAGADTMPGQIALEALGLTAETAASLPPEVYQAHMLAALGRAAISASAASRLGLILHYDDLPDALWTHIPRHFGICMDTAQLDAIKQASLRDAKRPGQPFQADGEAKRAAVSSWRDMADEITGLVIRELDGLRAAQR